MPKSETTEWLRKNAPLSKGKHRRVNRHANGRKMSSLTEIERRALGMYKDTIREFVEKHKDHKGNDCLFVLGATPGRPASMHLFGKTISAARYMLLLTQGAPSCAGIVARHKCGNGHLSCVNPAHLVWGTPGDNIGDATIHRNMEGATVEDKCRAVDARTSK